LAQEAGAPRVELRAVPPKMRSSASPITYSRLSAESARPATAARVRRCADPQRRRTEIPLRGQLHLVEVRLRV
jgi:hypothetical protein